MHVGGFALGDSPSLVRIHPHTSGLSNAMTPCRNAIRTLHDASTRPPERRASAAADGTQVQSGALTPDEERRAEGQVQKLTDDHVKRIDELLKHKESEIMEV